MNAHFHWHISATYLRHRFTICGLKERDFVGIRFPFLITICRRFPRMRPWEISLKMQSYAINIKWNSKQIIYRFHSLRPYPATTNIRALIILLFYGSRKWGNKSISDNFKTIFNVSSDYCFCKRPLLLNRWNIFDWLFKWSNICRWTGPKLCPAWTRRTDGLNSPVNVFVWKIKQSFCIFCSSGRKQSVSYAVNFWITFET